MGKPGTGRGHVNGSPSDSNNLPKSADGSYPRAIYFNQAGVARVIAPDDSIGDYTIPSAGFTLDVDAKRVNASGSSGITSFVAIY